MTQHLDEKYAGGEKIDTVISILSFLSDNFYATGNMLMANKLDEMARTLVEVKEHYELAHSLIFNEAIKSTEQATANIFNAVFAFAMKDTPEEK